jgi:hypothetical protein
MNQEFIHLTDTERASVQLEALKKGLTPLEFMELHEQKIKEKNTKEESEPKDLQILTYLYEQELSEDYPYWGMLEYSLVNERGYRMFPVFCPKKG